MDLFIYKLRDIFLKYSFNTNVFSKKMHKKPAKLNLFTNAKIVENTI